MFPGIDVFPRPEPDAQAVQEHEVWEEEYGHWGSLRCPCGRGYFCREHGDWISGDTVGDNLAPHGDRQKPGACPSSHYSGKLTKKRCR